MCYNFRCIPPNRNFPKRYNFILLRYGKERKRKRASVSLQRDKESPEETECEGMQANLEWKAKDAGLVLIERGK